MWLIFRELLSQRVVEDVGVCRNQVSDLNDLGLSELADDPPAWQTSRRDWPVEIRANSTRNRSVQVQLSQLRSSMAKVQGVGPNHP